jgi:hypothetical protein
MRLSLWRNPTQAAILGVDKLLLLAFAGRGLTRGSQSSPIDLWLLLWLVAGFIPSKIEVVASKSKSHTKGGAPYNRKKWLSSRIETPGFYLDGFLP